MRASGRYQRNTSYASAITSRSTTRHGVSGRFSARKRAILSVISRVILRARRLSINALPARPQAACQMGTAQRTEPRFDRTRTKTAPIRPFGALPASVCGLAQTARIDDPAAPPAQTRSAKIGVRAGHHPPESHSNHTGLPLGTDLAAGGAKRTRYVVA